MIQVQERLKAQSNPSHEQSTLKLFISGFNKKLPKKESKFNRWTLKIKLLISLLILALFLADTSGELLFKVPQAWRYHLNVLFQGGREYPKMSWKQLLDYPRSRELIGIWSDRRDQIAKVSDQVSNLVDSVETNSPLKSPSLRDQQCDGLIPENPRTREQGRSRASLLRESSSMAQKFRPVLLKRSISRIKLLLDRFISTSNFGVFVHFLKSRQPMHFRLETIQRDGTSTCFLRKNFSSSRSRFQN